MCLGAILCTKPSHRFLYYSFHYILTIWMQLYAFYLVLYPLMFNTLLYEVEFMWPTKEWIWRIACF